MPPSRKTTTPRAHTTDDQLKQAVKEAVEAFGALCDAATETIEYLLEELKEDRTK